MGTGESVRKFPKLNVDDRKLSMIQDNLANAIDPLLALPLSTSNLLEDVDLVSGNNTINHGLGRKLVGWFLTRKGANQDVYDSQSSNLLADKTLILVSTGTVTISLIVF